MTQVGVRLDTKELSDLILASKGNIKKAIGHGIRKLLATVEKHHKTVEFVRGGKQPPVPDKLTNRSRVLSRSYTRRLDQSKLIGDYGSGTEYARIHEFGGTIRTKYTTFEMPKRPTLQRTVDAVLGEGVIRVIGDEVEKGLDSA